MNEAFNKWWDEDDLTTQGNPYTYGTPVYWAWEGWQAALAAPVQEPVVVDQAIMELAESVGLIGPASRTHDLHAAIQRFHDLICVNATIKAAKMAADAIREATPPAAPVAWKWHQAPVKTSWGHDMVVADLAIDKDNTVSVYCERDQTTKVEAMFTPPAAQPAPVQDSTCRETLRAQGKAYPRTCKKCGKGPCIGAPVAPVQEPVIAQEGDTLEIETILYTSPQRTWVGLSEKEILKLAYPIRWQEVDDFEADKAVNFAQAIEAKLRSKNT